MKLCTCTLLLAVVAWGCSDDRRRGPTDSSITVDSATGDSTTGDTSVPRDGGDVPICDTTPVVDGACTVGETCQTAGSPCGSIWTCPDGMWDEEVMCPPEDTCPDELPEDMEPCTLNNPTAGPLTCTFDFCPSMPLYRAVCDGTAWTVTMEPCPGG